MLIISAPAAGLGRYARRLAGHQALRPPLLPTFEDRDKRHGGWQMRI